MLIPKKIFLDPGQNTPFAVFALAVSFFVFAYSTHFGQVAILAFYACWLPLLVLEPRLLINNGKAVVFLLILPTYALLSVFWSDLPGVTLRAAIQYGSTAVCGIIAARISVPRTLVLGGLIGSIFVLGYSYMYGNYAYDVLDGSYAFTGAFSSKNQLGLYASLAGIFAVAALILFRTGILWKICASFVFLLSCVTLVRAESATSMLTMAGIMTVITISLGLRQIRPSLRQVALGLGGLSAIALVFVAAELGLFEQMLSVFGKDATITGRTYLWQEGIQAGQENPYFGLGYYAFWSHGRLLAEQLWELFYISGRTGFHFHNIFIESFVGLGLLGTAMMLIVELALLALGLGGLVASPRTDDTVLYVALALLFVVRSFVEIDFFKPYTIGSFLVFYLLLQMSDNRRAVAQQARQSQNPEFTKAPAT